MTAQFPSRVSMTRRVVFSSGHRYWLRSLSDQENRRLFGKWASPFNHGHNYVLEVTVEGPVDPQTGMVLNIKRIDDLLKSRVVKLFDGKSINDEIPEFCDRPSTTENLVAFIWDLVSSDTRPDSFQLPKHVELTRIRLEETPEFTAELSRGPTQMNLTVTRTYEFAASHRLHVPSMSHEENEALFGKCNNPAGHGHNYLLEVTLTGEPSPETGMLVDLDALDEDVERLVLNRYDHKNLNVDVPELAGLVPTSEVVAAKIFEALDGNLPAKLYRVRLHETARNAFEVVAS